MNNDGEWLPAGKCQCPTSKKLFEVWYDTSVGINGKWLVEIHRFLFEHDVLHIIIVIIILSFHELHYFVPKAFSDFPFTRVS